MELEMHNDAQPGDEDLLNAAAIQTIFMVERYTPLNRKCRMIHLLRQYFATKTLSQND